MRRFRASAVAAVMDRCNIPEDVPLESKMVTRQIKSAQTQIEAQNGEIRKNVLKYDEVLNQQRKVIYAERKRVLDGEDLGEQVRNMLDEVVAAYVEGATSSGVGAEDWDLEQLWTSLRRLYPIGITIEDLEEEAGGVEAIDVDFLSTQLTEDAHAAYDRREEELGEGAVRELERQVLLTVIDRKWREHLYEMDYLQEGINLRAYAQRDPVVEYQREGFDMFQQMLDGIKEEVVGFLFNVEVQVEETPTAVEDGEGGSSVALPTGESHVEIHAKGLERNRRRSAMQYSAPTIDGEAGAGAVSIEKEQAPALGLGTNGKAAANGAKKSTRSGPPAPSAGARKPSPGQVVGGSGPARNGPCPCGSGKKYKRCHGKDVV
jgi:preprotein translocase subunit SecA